MNIRPFIYSALIVLMTSSCISNRIDRLEPDIELAFSVVVSASTKSEMTEIEYPTDVPFGVWSYSLPIGENWIDNKQKATVIQIQEEVRHDVSSGLWKPENEVSWVSSDKNMSFFAYSPYSRECSFSIHDGICVTDYSINEDCNLMFSENIYDINKNTSHGIVNIPFVNALTTVGFNVRSSLPDGTLIKVKKLKIHNIATAGDFFSLPEPRWENPKDYSDIIFFDGEMEIGNDPVKIGLSRQMIPQTIQPEIELVCDIISGDYILHDQSFKTTGKMRWSVGKTCTYNLKVTTDLTFIIESSLNE